MWLANDPPTRTLIMEAGALLLLVALLRAGTEQDKANAARALSGLVMDQNTRTQIMDAGALPLLVKLLRTGTELGKAEAARATSRLAQGPFLLRVVNAGALPPLIALVCPLCAGSKAGAGNNACLVLERTAADPRFCELVRELGAVGALATAAHMSGCGWADKARAALHAICPTQDEIERALMATYLENCILHAQRDASASCFESLASLAGPVSKGHDVVFRLSDGEIGCSRLLLARASPYYEKYLFGGTAESASVVVEPDPDFSSAAHIALLGQLHVMGHTPLLVELNARLELLCLASQPRCAERPADAAQTRRRACSSGASARCATCSARTTASPCCCSSSRTPPRCRSSSMLRLQP